jgi:methionine synthase II (cobalamin-independent)
MTVTRDTAIEELVEKIPQAVTYLSKAGIRCVICGEPIWGTLENAAKEKGFGDDDITRFVADLNRLQDTSADTQVSES